jgi:hypothetical protein
MPGVTFDVVYLHRADDPATYIALYLDEEVVTPSKPGDIRVMANGRRRAVFKPGSSAPISGTTDFVDPADRQTLEAWVQGAVLILLREPRGRVAWGHIFATPTTEKPAANVEALLTWTFEPISFTEEV